MALDRKLLDILCCPITKSPVRPLTRDALKIVNHAIEAGTLVNLEGRTLDRPLKEGLITDNNERVYPVEDGIPVMLEGEAIPVKELHLK